ncbi:DUF6461 domain-containing protein [[Kitasatospora] papulosa]|uniref:DUF6461 domain-containing protein n=1 Tax=[Kitasatospora] papulosa TaxID=1464011 RepID=UPI0036AB70FA
MPLHRVHPTITCFWGGAKTCATGFGGCSIWSTGCPAWCSHAGYPRRSWRYAWGGDRDAATEPITDAEAWGLGEWYRPGEDGDGVVRVGEQEGWAFALEYGDSTGGDRLAEISQKGIEAVHYVPMQEHPPATVFHARDGVEVCGFGLREEVWRWGREPDLLLPDLISGHVLQPDGKTRGAPATEHYTDAYRRTLGVIEQRFGLSLSPAYLKEVRLPAYAVRGTPDMHV